MKSILKQISDETREAEKRTADSFSAEISDPSTSSDRRTFFKKTALGGIALGGTINMPVEDTIAQTTSKVSRLSNPSDLKITDIRYTMTNLMGTSIIRIDTNQGIYGLGDVRGGADPRQALTLKARLLGQNPCNVEMIFKTIKQFGNHGRLGAGVCAVEMALWDLCGKAYGVPAWLLLGGGRYRDKIRIYADTPISRSPEEQLKLIRKRTEQLGYTWLKMDVSIEELRNIPGTLVNTKFWGNIAQYDLVDPMGYGNTKHPFTQVQITDKGLEELAKIVENVRNIVGYDIPLSTDHFGHFDLNNGIRLGKALEKYKLAWMEDLLAWDLTDQLKTISDALDTPVLTGEDIYLLQGFKPLIDIHAVDIVHPDLAAAGGLLETKKIGDYAEEHGIAMAMHWGGTPVSFMANVHCAAATQNFLALEHHFIDSPWWESMVKMTGSQPIITKGFANVPLDSPGLGIELNDDVIKEHLEPDSGGYFEPTPEWNKKGFHDRIWS
jgi:L-alanine-DL-glutamate epimerase-like enolase superfamily enzyme